MYSGKWWAATAVMLVAAGSVQAGPVTFSGADAAGRKASATFTASDDHLIITLTNTAQLQSADPTWLLTGVFFLIDTPVTLTAQTALLAPGSTILYAPPELADTSNVSGEWAYRDGSFAPLTGVNQGVAAAGLGLFGPPDLFAGGTNLSGPINVGGMDYSLTAGIAAAPVQANPAVTGSVPLISNAVIFTLAGLPADFDPALHITAASFQYGTSTGDPRLVGTPDSSNDHGVISVPAPAATWLGLTGLALFPLARRRPRP